MMEVVELVEVVESGEQHHQQEGMENFEDLILTVVPEGQEGESAAMNAASGGQRTIMVTEVRGDRVVEDQQKDKEIETLKGRVEQLEDQVHFLEDELRIMRRKVVQGNAMNSYNAIRRTVFDVLQKQTLKLSLSDFEDEMEPPEPLWTPGPSRKRRYENGMDEEDEDDFNFSDEEEQQPRLRRRGRRPGRPPKGSKPRTSRFELTPPPPKVSRPRGRPRRVVPEDKKEETTAETETTATPAVDKVENEKGNKEEEKMEVGAENTTTESPPVVDENVERQNDTNEEEMGEDNADAVADSAITPEEDKKPEIPVPEDKGTPKKGRRPKAAVPPVEKEAEATPTRTSARTRRTSRKGSE